MKKIVAKHFLIRVDSYELLVIFICSNIMKDSAKNLCFCFLRRSDIIELFIIILNIHNLSEFSAKRIFSRLKEE